MDKLDRKMNLKSKTHAAGLSSTSLPSSSLSWIVVILGLTALIGQGHAITLTVDTTSARVHVGDNVTVVCRVSPANYGTMINFLKVVVASNGTEHEETISLNNIITPLYLNTGRYSATIGDAGETILFFLYITNFQPEDSGAFVCSHLQETSAKQGTSVEVYTQPEKIWFEGYEDGDTIHFEEGDGRPISCLTTHASPSPKMSITMGSQDLTETFTSDGTMHVRCPEEDLEKTCLLTADHDASLTTDSFVPYYEYDEGRLICSADIGEDSGLEPIETSLKLDVAYAPKIIEESCLPEYRVKEGENLQIQCTVRFNPEPEDGFVFWFATSTSTGKNYTLEPLQTNHEAGFRAGKQVVDHKVWLVTLGIDYALPRHSTNFDLIVVNRLGRVQHPIHVHVEKAEEAGSVGGLAVTVSINEILLLTAAILARVSHL